MNKKILFLALIHYGLVSTHAYGAQAAVRQTPYSAESIMQKYGINAEQANILSNSHALESGQTTLKELNKNLSDLWYLVPAKSLSPFMAYRNERIAAIRAKMAHVSKTNAEKTNG